MESNPDPDTEDQIAKVATQIRRRRSERGWTLDVAAPRLGVSRRLLVQLEAAEANPSLSTLLSIAEGFDIALVDLLTNGDKPTVVVQADNATAPVMWSTERGSEARLLVGSGALELWEWVLAPGDTRAAHAHRPGSREVISVAAGALTIRVGSATPVTVRAGQSVSIHADEPHAYANDTGRPVRFAMAVHEPSGPGR